MTILTQDVRKSIRCRHGYKPFCPLVFCLFLITFFLAVCSTTFMSSKGFGGLHIIWWIELEAFRYSKKKINTILFWFGSFLRLNRHGNDILLTTSNKFCLILQWLRYRSNTISIQINFSCFLDIHSIRMVGHKKIVNLIYNSCFCEIHPSIISEGVLCFVDLLNLRNVQMKYSKREKYAFFL